MTVPIKIMLDGSNEGAGFAALILNAARCPVLAVAKISEMHTS